METVALTCPGGRSNVECEAACGRNLDAGGEVAGPANKPFSAARIRPKLSVKTGSADYCTREQMVNFDFATSINLWSRQSGWK